MNGILDDLKNVFRKPDNALLRLIIINVIVFLGIEVLVTTLGFFRSAYANLIANLLRDQVLLPGQLGEFIFRPWTILSYAFGHAGLGHIFWNMLFLYWFGLIITEYLGSKRLISLYVLGALAGGLSFLMLNLITQRADVLIGASGAVYAVMVGAATLTPNYTFHLLFIGPVRIKYIAAVYIVLSYIGLRGLNTGGDLAHLAGALIGYMFIVQLKKGTDLGKWIHDFMEFVSNLFQRKPKMRVSYNKSKSKVTANTAYRNSTKSNGENMPGQDEIDAILDKISASGYESLTKEEKQKLFRASKS
ncbi:MAG: rhomboid family intramembrane serine protease [Microscillaceae bacterium]|nr:rhomboid family intramembrane serine protease [Microscillaceae bacterium]